MSTGFWCGPKGNDTIPLPCQAQMADKLTEYRFEVPAGETWLITRIVHMLYCGDQEQNPVVVLMHIFMNEPAAGRNTQVWSKQAHFAQRQYTSATDTGNGVVPPQMCLVTDVGEANYWRYFDEDCRIPLFGPCVVEVGAWNGNEAGGPEASMHLSFAVEKQ